MIQYTPYTLTSLLSSAILLVMAVCLFFVSLPQGKELRDYRISRRLLSVAYLILSTVSLVGIFWKSQLHEDVTVALFQALLFTYSLIALLNNGFITKRRMIHQLLLILVITAFIFYNTFVLLEPAPILTYISQGAYFSLFAFYIWQFFREYISYKKRADNYYSGNEYRLLRWVLHIYIIVIVTGIFAGLIVENNIYFLIFIIAYTLVYVYMAIKYMNYITLFHHIAPIVTQPENALFENENTEISNTALNQWIKDKGFLSPNITLGKLARELNTNQSYLSRYINAEYKQNYRSWINSLRIRESMELMEQDSKLSLPEIAEQIGIPSMSTFYRHFSVVAGMTPQEYRKQIMRSHHSTSSPALRHSVEDETSRDKPQKYSPSPRKQ